jgi:hypothetical protein
MTDYTISDPDGVQIRIASANGGPYLINTRMYSNGMSIPVYNLVNGTYRVYANASDFSPLVSTLVIMR